MLNGRFISIERIAERVYNSGLNNDEIQFPDIIEWVGEAISLIGVQYAYEEKVSDEIEVTDYRASLPSDLAELYSVREYDDKYPMVSIDGTFRPTYENSNLKDDDDPVMLGYYVNDNYIFTNTEEMSVEISYKAFVTDANGYPEIPDDERYIRAVVAYCEYVLGRKMYLQDKLSEKKYLMLEQDWLFYVNSAAVSAHIPNVDQAESLKNQLQRMIGFAHHHATGFAYRNTPEFIKIHNPR
jgi:hypothetical protein